MRTDRSDTENSKIADLILKVDSSHLREDFEKWPELASESWEKEVPYTISEIPNTILIAGMGGSGIIGELISDIFHETKSKIQIRTIKDYHLPPDVNSNSMLIAVSSSGNTEETLSVLHEASERGLRGFTFGGGGLIEEFSKKNNRSFQYTKTQALKVPRTSLPALFYPVLKLLIQSKLLTMMESDVKESIGVLQECKTNSSDFFSNFPLVAGEKLSADLVVPLVYSSRRTRAVGLRFRQSLNENAKLHSFDGVVPELCHNEIVAWDYSSGLVQNGENRQSVPIPFLLQLDDDPAEIRTRMNIISEIIARNGVESIEAPHHGKSYLARLVSMLYLLDYSTFFASVMRGVDPIGTPSIDYLKRELHSRLDYLKRFG